MSHRHIDENLEYFASNQGLHYNAPIVEIGTNTPTVQGHMNIVTNTIDVTVGNAQLFGNYTLNGNPIQTGTLQEGRNIHIEGSPNQSISAQYPRHSSFNVNVNLLAGVPQVVDWTGFTQGQDSFTLAPNLISALNYVNLVPGTPTDWRFTNGGYYDFFLRSRLAATLGANQEYKCETQVSADAGMSWGMIDSEKQTIGGVGSLSVDFVGGHKTFIYAPQGATPGDQRVRFLLTCTENKTLNAEVFWILCGRDV